MVMHSGVQPFSRVSENGRVHVMARHFGDMPFATDYWFWPHPDVITASTPGLLIDNGWNSSGTLTVTDASGADFSSPSDFGVPAHVLLDAAGDLLQTPPMFGGYETMYFIKQFLGHIPVRVTAEFYAAFLTASNDESASGIGFVEDGGTPAVANDHLAAIRSDGANFILRSDAAADSGAAVDTSWHRFKIVIEFGKDVNWFIDGVSQGGIALKTDEFPCSFGAGILASTGANDIGWGATHIWYD